MALGDPVALGDFDRRAPCPASAPRSCRRRPPRRRCLSRSRRTHAPGHRRKRRRVPRRESRRPARRRRPSTRFEKCRSAPARPGRGLGIEPEGNRLGPVVLGDRNRDRGRAAPDVVVGLAGRNQAFRFALDEAGVDPASPKSSSSIALNRKAALVRTGHTSTSSRMAASGRSPRHGPRPMPPAWRSSGRRRAKWRRLPRPPSRSGHLRRGRNARACRRSAGIPWPDPRHRAGPRWHGR